MFSIAEIINEDAVERYSRDDKVSEELSPGIDPRRAKVRQFKLVKHIFFCFLYFGLGFYRIRLLIGSYMGGAYCPPLKGARHRKQSNGAFVHREHVEKDDCGVEISPKRVCGFATTRKLMIG